MTKQRTLTDKQIETLIRLSVLYKKAKDDFEEAKKILTSNLECGKYSSSKGYVSKNKNIRMVLNMERLAFEHPEINLDDYKDPIESTLILVKNLNLA